MADQKFKSKVRLQGGVALPAESISRAVEIDANGELKSSVTTNAELAHLSGVTSNVQSQITDAQADATQALADAAAAQADATQALADAAAAQSTANSAQSDATQALADAAAAQADATQALADASAAQSDVNDLVTLSGVAANSTNLGSFSGTTIADNSTIKAAIQSLETALESLPDPMEYKGSWSAATNTPSLADGAGNNGDVYHVNAAGSVDFGNGSISFVIGDKVVYNGATAKWEKWDLTDSVTSVFGRSGAVTAQSGDYTAQQITNVPSGNILATDVQAAINELDSEKAAVSHTHVAADITDFAEAAQDAIGAALSDSASIDLSYNDGTNTISASVLPAGVDHDALQNFVANEHIDHSSVIMLTDVNSALGGGGDLTATRDLYVDVMNSPLVSPTVSDHILVADASNADQTSRITVQSLIDLAGGSVTDHINDTVDAHDASAISVTPAGNLASTDVQAALQELQGDIDAIPTGSAGDIAETSFSIANNQASAANVTGLSFNTAVVRSFKALVSIEIDATLDLWETVELVGINKGGSFDMAQSGAGDESGIVLSITAGGQVQYTSANYSGFVSGLIKFRAITTTV